jgi:hypothetical protein
LTSKERIAQKQGTIDRRCQENALETRRPPSKSIVGESQHILDVCQQILTDAPPLYLFSLLARQAAAKR